jgi:pyruvate carboxylase
MKQEKAVRAKTAGVVKKIHKTADFRHTKQMTPVRAGEIIVELAPPPVLCSACAKALPAEDLIFCPYCGLSLKS